jgi:hypothetical protein
MKAWTPLVVLDTGEHEVAVCRDEEHAMLLVTAREAGAADWGAGSGIEGYAPTWMGLPGRWALGGRAPAGAARVEVRDARGEPQPAALGDGAWVATSPMWTRGSEQESVLFRDAAGAVVPRPGPAGAPVTDASTACPACGTCRWELPDAPEEMGREVRCATCGHGVRMGVFFGPGVPGTRIVPGAAVPSFEERTREALAEATFPLFTVAGGAPRVTGYGHSDSVLSRVRLTHGGDQPVPGEPWVSVETELERWAEDPGLLARDARAGLVGVLAAEQWPPVSHAAVSLWLDARRREQARTAALAPQAERDIPVDGVPHRFAVTGEDARWAAAARLELDGQPLQVVVQAAGIAPPAVALARLREAPDTLAP